MSAYIIEVDDSKQGVCYPTVVGPFADSDSAERFIQRAGMGTAAELNGGYSAAHVVCDARCDYSPEGYLEAYSWRFEDDDEEKVSD